MKYMIARIHTHFQRWAVGFFGPDGNWIETETFSSFEDAEETANRLNRALGVRQVAIRGRIYDPEKDGKHG